MLVSAFIFGLLSSLHCVGMCGPIAFALPVHKGSFTEKWSKVIVYHLGRIVTYMVIGAIFGLFGRAFVLAGLQQLLSIVAGVVLIIIAIFQKTILNRLEEQSSLKVINLIKNLYQKIAKSKSVVNFFSLGLLNGLLPCGTVYIALIGAIASENLLSGSIYMLFFGLGTLPLMLILMGANIVSSVKFKSFFKVAVPFILIIVGSLFIIRGLGFGVSFMSPSDVSLKVNIVPIGCH